jgi:electron transport complex protein RnfD
MLFGVPALLVLIVSIGASLVSEVLSSLLFRRFTLNDGSAFLTGLLVGLLMPSGVPLYVPAAASAFAILVVKQSFGGLGRNWMNPAMAGVLFAMLSWSGAMSNWGAAQGILGNVTSLPPLEALRAALAAPEVTGRAPLAVLAGAGYRFSNGDASIIAWINSRLLAPLGAALQPGSFDVLVGHVSGRIGEISAPLLLLGAGFLLHRRIVRWQVPVSYLASFLMLAWIFGGLGAGRGWLAGGPVFHVLSGSLILGAFFIASDPVTSPLSEKGRWIYGLELGALTFFMRYFGTLGDGVAVSIVLANCTVPLLDRWLQHREAAPLREAS